MEDTKKLPEPFTLRTAAFWLCKKEPTVCIFDNDVNLALGLLKSGGGKNVLRVWYKDYCNFTSPNIVTIPYENTDQIFVTQDDLKTYLECLFDWASGEAFSKRSERIKEDIHFSKSQDCFNNFEILLRSHYYAIRDSQKWLSIIEDAISRLGAEVQAEKRQDEGQGEAVPSLKSNSPFSCSRDYHSVAIRGQKFSLTSKQAQVIQILHNEYNNGTPEISTGTVAEELGNAFKKFRLKKDVFRGSEDAYAALIVAGKKKGTIRLNI